MSNTELINTYEEHEKKLTKIWINNAKTQDHMVNRESDLDYLLILDGLVEPDQQWKMYQKLRKNFCKSNTEEDISTNVSRNFAKFCFNRIELEIIHFFLIIFICSMRIYFGK